jgi:hypothetical protein
MRVSRSPKCCSGLGTSRLGITSHEIRRSARTYGDASVNMSGKAWRYRGVLLYPQAEQIEPAPHSFGGIL